MLLPLCALAQGSSAGSMLPYSTNGVKVGDGRLHVTGDVEARFDSAAGFFARESGGELTLQPELVWHFRPGLSFEVPGSAFDFRVAGNLDYLLYSGLVTRGSGSASRLQGGADLGITVNKNGVVELRLTDTFSRSDNTSNVGLGFATLSLGNFAKVEVPIRPGGGALEIAPGGGYGLEVFSPIASMRGGGLRRRLLRSRPRSRSSTTRPRTARWRSAGASCRGPRSSWTTTSATRSTRPVPPRTPRSCAPRWGSRVC